MGASHKDWSRAYAQQALSDLRARNVLASANLDRCHSLHYLQMAAEKVCKAYIANNDKPVIRSHDVVSKNLPLIAKSILSRTRSAKDQLRSIKQVAYEIDSLAPAVEQGGARLDNSEYPWLDQSGNVQAPCLYAFRALSDDRLIAIVVKLLLSAAEEYLL